MKNNKMNFEEFQQAIADGVKGFLPENFDLGEIKLNVVTKNNNMKLTGLTIMRRDSIIAPTIYLEAYYQKYSENDADLSEIMKEIVKLRMESECPDDSFDIGQIRNLENCKDKIFPRLIGTQWNEGLLNERPHILIAGDLAVTFVIELGECQDGSMSISIHNKMAAAWKVTAEELYDIAMSNLETADCGVVVSMKELLRERAIAKLQMKFGDRELAENYYDNVMMLDNDMYIVTNKKKTNGACMVLDPKTIQKVIDRIGSDFYILPSSIHECIVLAWDYGSADELKEIVMQVNEEQVDVPERLSDSVYHYTPETGFVKAED